MKKKIFLTVLAAGAPPTIVGINLEHMMDIGKNRYVLEFDEYFTYTHEMTDDFPTSTDYNDWWESYLSDPRNEITESHSQAVIEKKVVNGKAVWHIVFYNPNTGELTSNSVKNYQNKYTWIEIPYSFSELSQAPSNLEKN